MTSVDRGPGWLPVTLTALATVVGIVSAMTTWVRTQALDTDEWVDISTELIDEPRVREALAVYLTDQLYERIDVAGELEARLPDVLSPLAAPVAGALRDPFTRGVERVLESDSVESLWTAANRRAHETLVAILRDETREGVTTADGSVTLELGTVLRGVGGSLGLPDAALDRIPDDAGRIVVFESDELDAAQETVRVLDVLSWFLFVVVLLLYVLAVVLARGRRREALRTVGIGLAVGSVALLLLRSLGVRTTVDLLVEDPDRQALATAVADIATSLLRQMAWTGVVYGVLVIAFAELIGDHRWARTIRRKLGGWSASPGAVAATAVLVVLVLLWWSPGRSFDRWVTALTLAVLAVAAVVALAVVVARETAGPETPETDPDADDGADEPDGPAGDEAVAAAGERGTTSG